MMPKEKEDGEFMDSLEIEGKDKGIGVYREHKDTPPSLYMKLCIEKGCLNVYSRSPLWKWPVKWIRWWVPPCTL